MSIKVGRIEQHWSYLLTLEQDVQRLARFVEFHEDNFLCYSVEIAHLLLAAAAECDVVCKQICRRLNENSRARVVGQYKTEILAAYPKLPKFIVEVPRYALTLTPWINWDGPKGSVPLWWTANNKVKHQRNTHFAQGNLKNALNAVAGLFVLVLHLYVEKAREGYLVPSPQLLRPADMFIGGFVNFGGDSVGLKYFL